MITKGLTNLANTLIEVLHLFSCCIEENNWPYWQMDGIPVEIQERILWFLRHDSVTLHRVEQVCVLWAEIVRFFEEYKSVRWRTIKVNK